eukprot:gene11091-12259_t
MREYDILELSNFDDLFSTELQEETIIDARRIEAVNWKEVVPRLTSLLTTKLIYSLLIPRDCHKEVIGRLKDELINIFHRKYGQHIVINGRSIDINRFFNFKFVLDKVVIDRKALGENVTKRLACLRELLNDINELHDCCPNIRNDLLNAVRNLKKRMHSCGNMRDHDSKTGKDDALKTGIILKMKDMEQEDRAVKAKQHRVLKKFQVIASEFDTEDQEGETGIDKDKDCKTKCYICKERFNPCLSGGTSSQHARLCAKCRELNDEMRNMRTDLTGRFAVVTGARIKIGYETALKLLRDGCFVIATTRFPQDAALKYSKEKDYESWCDRLQIYPLDLLDIKTVHKFIEYLNNRIPHLDILINNAAQTISRPLQFYQHLFSLENTRPEVLDVKTKKLLVPNVHLNYPKMLTSDDNAPITPKEEKVERRLTMKHGRPEDSFDDHNNESPIVKKSRSDDFPSNSFDQDGQQIDLRKFNSWKYQLSDIPFKELLDVLTINTLGPFILVSQLKSLMRKSIFERKFIVNVSAMEGQFHRNNKTHQHPHTNMAKAALNMLTRTSGLELVVDHIYMTSVDTGWVSDERPFHEAEYQRIVNQFHVPLDCIDGASRIYHPIVHGLMHEQQQQPYFAVFLKDYKPSPCALIKRKGGNNSIFNMASADTPSKLGRKLDSLPKEELIKYIKKQATQMKDLKKKSEDLKLMLDHEKKEVDKLSQEQKSWLSRGVTAEFEKKEKLEKKERELQMAAQLGQQMLIENDELRQKCDNLEKKHMEAEQELKDEIIQLVAEKETIEKTLIMIQDEYKVAKLETQKLKNALETSAADQDKEHVQWENERQSLNKIIMNLENDLNNSKGKNADDYQIKLSIENQALQEDLKSLQFQIDEFKEQEKENGTFNLLARENEELKNKLECDIIEIKELGNSLKYSQEECKTLKTKNEELNKIVDMLSVARDESNNYSQQLVQDLSKVKEEKEKILKSFKAAKGKLERSSSAEEELRQHLNSVTSDRNELQIMVKNVQREKKTLIQSNKKLKERLKGTANRHPADDSTNEQALENAELKKELNKISINLKMCSERYSIEKQEISEELEASKRKMENLKEQLNEKQSEIEKNVIKNEEDKSAIMKLQSRVDELLSTLQSLNEEKLHQESEIEELFKTQDDLQNKYDDECNKRKIMDAEITKLKNLMEEQDKLLAQKQNNEIKDVEEGEVQKTEDGSVMSETTVVQSELTNDGRDDEEIIRLKHELKCLEDELEFERKEKRVIESNFREKISSIDEFEENEKKIILENEESKVEIDRLKLEIDELKNAHERSRERDEDEELLNRNEKFEECKIIINDLEMKLQQMEGKMVKTEEENVSKDKEIKQLNINVNENEKVKILQEEKISNMNEELSRLENEIQGLKTYILELKEHQAVMSGKDHEGHEEGESLAKEQLIMELQVELKELKGIDESKQKLFDENQCLSQEILKLKSEIELLNDEGKTTNFEFEEEIAKIEEEKNNLLESLTKTKEEVDKLHDENGQLKSTALEVNELKETLLQQDLKSLKSNEDIQKEKSELQRKLDESIVFAEELETQMKSHAERIAHQEEELIAKKFIIDEKIQVAMEKDNAIIKLKDELTDLNERIVSITENKNAERNIIDNYERRIKELEGIDETISNALKSTEETLEREKQSNMDIKLENEKLNKYIEDLSEELKATKENVSILSEKKNSLSKEIDEVKEEKVELEMKLGSFEENESELQKVRAECLEKEEKVNEYEKIIKDRNNLMENMQTELSDMKQLLRSHADGSEINEKQMNHLENQLKNALKEIEQFELKGKEKDEKINKLKSVAIKAKKELESFKTKELEKCYEENKEYKGKIQEFNYKLKEYQDESEFLNQEIEKKSARIKDADEEIINLKQKIDKLRVSLVGQENQVASIKDISNEKQKSIDKLNKQISEANARIIELDEEIMKEKQKNEDANEKMSKISEDLDSSKKDAHQMKMMSLEMQDCQRTVELLQSKLHDKEAENETLQNDISTLKDQMNSREQRITTLLEHDASSKSEIKRITTLSIQQECEINKLITETSENETKITELKNKIEEVTQTSEDRMLQISQLAGEKEKLFQQLKNEKELHERNSNCLEIKLSRLQTDYGLLQEAYNDNKEEFESYKVRAQNVLKQQKMKKNQNEDLQLKEERLKLEQLVAKLKETLKEKGDFMATLSAEHEDLEAEHEKLNEKFNLLMKEASEKEMEWRNRLSEVQNKAKLQLIESEEKWKIAIAEKESVEEKFKNSEEYERVMEQYEQTIEDLKAKLNEKRSIKRQNSRPLKNSDDNENNHKSNIPDNLQLNQSDTSQDSTSNLIERPGAEGMDSTELEAIDRPSQPTTPATPDSASILGKLLSPKEPSFSSGWPSSPTLPQEDGKKLQSVTEKNLEHLSELLAESESSNLLLDEQVKVLKAEIRRMQQNQEREEALHNLEYLKNVIIKFMKCGPAEKECLIPVLSTMLKLDAEEKSFMSEFARAYF